MMHKPTVRIRLKISQTVTFLLRIKGQKDGDYLVIPPFLAGLDRRIHAAIFSFCAGVMPPMPMLGRSLL
jgi:hypothetical protein